MRTVTVEEAQATLRELIYGMEPGEEVIITENGQAVARLIRLNPDETVSPVISPGCSPGGDAP